MKWGRAHVAVPGRLVSLSDHAAAAGMRRSCKVRRIHICSLGTSKRGRRFKSVVADSIDGVCFYGSKNRCTNISGKWKWELFGSAETDRIDPIYGRDCFWDNCARTHVHL